jgi:SsrA-binding protein
VSNASKKAPEGVKVIATNKRARFDYQVEETLEAGVQLLGSEVKSVRDGTVNLADSYAVPSKQGELFLHSMRIGPYNPASVFTHDALRTRKLLLHRNELDKWISKVRERGYSIIPLMLYFKNGKAKVELALCRGKTHEDRRQDIKARETQREIDRATRRR